MTKKKLSPDSVLNELRGQSVFFQQPKVPDPPPAQTSPTSPTREQSRTTEVQQSDSADVRNSGSAEVQQSSTLTLDDLGDYPLLDFREYKKIDARLSWDQKEYLDHLERLIARDAPGVEKGNPLSKRITRSSILRALVEIARRLRLHVNPSRFQNERDLIEALADALRQSLVEKEEDQLQ